MKIELLLGASSNRLQDAWNTYQINGCVPVALISLAVAPDLRTAAQEHILLITEKSPKGVDVMNVGTALGVMELFPADEATVPLDWSVMSIRQVSKQLRQGDLRLSTIIESGVIFPEVSPETEARVRKLATQWDALAAADEYIYRAQAAMQALETGISEYRWESRPHQYELTDDDVNKFSTLAATYAVTGYLLRNGVKPNPFIWDPFLIATDADERSEPRHGHKELRDILNPLAAPWMATLPDEDSPEYILHMESPERLAERSKVYQSVARAVLQALD